MERRSYEQITVAPPDPGLRQPPSAEEIARRAKVLQEVQEDRQNTPPLEISIVELIRQAREEFER